MTNFKTQLSMVLPSHSDIQNIVEMEAEKHKKFIRNLGIYLHDIQERAAIVCAYTNNYHQTVNEAVAIFMQMCFPEYTDKQKAKVLKQATENFTQSN